MYGGTHERRAKQGGACLVSAAALAIWMVGCVSAPTPVAGIRISAVADEPAGTISIPFDEGADGQEVVRQLLVSARDRGAYAVSGLEFHIPYRGRRTTYECIGVVGTPDDAYARANRLLKRRRAFVLQPRRDQPERCERHARNTVLPIASGCQGGARYTATTRYVHFDQNDFTPVDWELVEGAYTDAKVVAAPQVCVRARGGAKRELRAGLHFAPGSHPPPSE